MTPAARVTFNGKDISTKLTRDGGPLISLTVRDEAGHKADTFEMELDARQPLAAPPEGAILKVWLGYEPAPVYMGSFKVDEWEKRGSRRVLRVSAKSAELVDSLRDAKFKGWHKKALGEIARTIAGYHGLQAVVDADLDAVVIDHVDQQHESDMAFLTRLAHRTGATFKLADGKVILSKPGKASLPSGGAKPSTTLREADLSDWSVRVSGRGNYKAVTTYYDVGGERTAVHVGSGKRGHRDRKLYATKAEATAAANAHLGRAGRGSNSGSLSMPGRTDLFADGSVTLALGDSDVDGVHRIKSIEHTFGNQGFLTRLEIEDGKPDPAFTAGGGDDDDGSADPLDEDTGDGSPSDA